MSEEQASAGRRTRPSAGSGEPDRPKVAGFIEQRTLAHALPANPHEFAPFDAADQAALKALRDGNPSPDQCKRALGWILFVTGLNDEPWRPGGVDGERNSNYAAGKRKVGIEIRRLLELPFLGKGPGGGEQGDR